MNQGITSRVTHTHTQVEHHTQADEIQWHTKHQTKWHLQTNNSRVFGVFFYT